jgi:hypothetical protein
MKQILARAPIRKQLWISKTGLPLPPDPVITRWGTWLNTAIFYGDYFDKTVDFFEEIENKSEAIKKAKKIIKRKDFKDEIVALHEFKFIPDLILKLETQGLKTSEQIEVLDTLKRKLTGPSLAKLNSSLDKNPGFKSFIENDSVEFRIKTKYAPLVSVDVERSFSSYKALLRDNRQRFLPENIEQHLIIQFNSFLNLA